MNATLFRDLSYLRYLLVVTETIILNEQELYAGFTTNGMWQTGTFGQGDGLNAGYHWRNEPFILHAPPP
jgi:hypothetical protein